MAANGGMNMSVGLDLSQLQKDLNRLHSELKTATPDQVIRIKAEFKKNRSDIRKEMKTLKAEMGKLVTVIPTDLQKREEYLKRLISLQQLYNETYSRSTAKGKQQLEYLQASLRMTQSALHGNNLLEKQAGILGKLGTLASRYFNIFAATAFGKKILDITGYFEQQKVALEGILGSAAKAETALQRIKSMALSSPKTTKELVGYTKQLAAYDVGEGDPKKLLDTVHELTELSTGLGVDMQRLILAYGQVNAASVLRGQELRQFTEAGIPLVDKLAKKFSDLNGRLVTTGEVFELISKRQVSFEMVASVLSDMTKEGGKFYEMQSRITETTYGQKQKLKDIWDLELDKLGKDSNNILMGIIKALQSIVRNLKPIIIAISTLVTLKAIPNIIARCIALSTQWKRDVVSLGFAWKYLKMEIKEAKGFAEKFAVLQRAFGSGFGELGLNVALMALGAIVGIIAKAAQKSREWKRELNEINTSFAKDTINLQSGLDKLIGKLQTLNKNSKEYKDTLDTLKSNYGEYANDNIINTLVKEAEAAESTAVSWGKLAEAIKQAVFEKKEYERHETIKNTAIDNIIGDIEDKLLALSNTVKGKHVLSSVTDMDSNTVTTYDAIGNELKQKNAQKALSTAAREYLTLGATEDQLPAIIDKWAKRYGFTPETAAALSGESGSVLKSIKRSSYYDKYAESESYITSALQNVINRAFQDASQRISDNYANYTGEKGKNYNPFGINAFSNEQYIEALNGLLASSYVPKDFQDKLANDKAYQDALALDNSNAGKTLAIVNALNALIGNLKDVSLKTNLAAISSEFEKIAGTNGVDASRIRTNMSNYALFGGMNLTDKEKDYIKKWEPTDQNVKSNIAEIASEYQSMYDFNKKLGDKEGTFSETYQENERLMKILDILAKPEYYNQDSWLKKSGSGGTEREFPDFFNIFKNAYDQYKRAAQQGGVANAVNEFRSNPTLRSQYGDMFGIEGSIKEFGFKIGDKTVSQIIEDNLIKGGLEDGVVDFKKAAQETAKTLLDYGRANEKERGAFIRIGEQIQKWVTETFTKDEVQKWLDEFQKSVESLTNDFENMHNNIELARKMSANGTVGSFEQVTGLSGVNYTRPQSVGQREDLAKLVAKYNKFAGSVTGKNGETVPVFELGDISNLKGIHDQIKALDKTLDVNNEAFRALPQGEIMVKALIQALKNLDKTVRDEIGNISGEKFTGNAMQDVISEALRIADIAQRENVKAQENSFDKGLGYNAGAGKAYNQTLDQQAQAIYDQFIKDNDFSAMANAGRYFGGDSSQIKQLMEKLDKIIAEIEKTNPALASELRSKKTDFEQKELAFRSENGDFGAFMKSIGQFFGAHDTAQQMYNEKKQERDNLSMEALNLESDISEGQGYLSEEELTAMTERLNVVQSQLATCNKELSEMGENGMILEKNLRMNALKDMQKNLNKASGTLDAMKNAVTSVVDAAKALSKAINKVYDVMNDGENPAWMQDMEGFLEDFGEAFEMLVAPIGAVIAMITALTIVSITAEAVMTPLLIVMLAIIAAAVIVAAIVAAFQQHDRKLERSIDGLKKEVEEFGNAITNLNAAAERMVGFEKLKTQADAFGKSISKATDYAEMARLEEEKKNTDDDKVKEYKQSYQEALDEFLNGIREIRDELVSSTEDWASTMSDAIRSAFQNGENAARAFRDNVKTMIGDVIEKMLQMAILEPLIENAIQSWTNSDYLRDKYTNEWYEEDDNGKLVKKSEFDQDNYLKELVERIQDPEKAEQFYQSMLMIGDTLIDTVDGMNPLLKDFYMHNSELGTLSGGIESVTEDTARRIEALGNSQLGEVIAIRMLLDNYLSGGDGFGDSTMATIQASIASISSDTSAISRATDAILNHINELRTSPAKPIHVTMS